MQRAATADMSARQERMTVLRYLVIGTQRGQIQLKPPRTALWIRVT